jgi:hypothetical protein
VLEQLTTRYRDVPYEMWEQLQRDHYSLMVGSEDLTVPAMDGWWRARIESLEIDCDAKGDFVVVSLVVYSDEVRAVPPAPQGSLVVYRHGRVEVSHPEREYTYAQMSCRGKKRTPPSGSGDAT